MKQNRRDIILMVNATKVGVKTTFNKEKKREKILSFLREPVLRLGDKKGFAVDEKGEPISIEYFESLDTKQLIKEFKELIDDFEEYVRYG